MWVSDTQIAEASVDRKSAGGNIQHCFCEELFSCGANFDAWLKNFIIIVNLVRPLHRYQHILENAFRYLRRFSPSLISSECTNLVFGIFSPPALALGGFFYALARLRIATAVRWPIGQLRSLFPWEAETLLADFPICPIIRLHTKARQ